MRRHRDQQAGRHRREKDPARTHRPVRRGNIGVIACRFDNRVRGRSQQQHAAGGYHQDQQTVTGRPHPILRAQREHRLQQKRIGQEREEAADIRGSIEKVWIGTIGMSGPHEPCLQKRIVRCEREERQSDRDREQAEQPDCVSAGRRLAPAIRDRQRQRQQRHQQQQQMHYHRDDAAANLHQKMRVGIAGQQQ